MIKRNIQVKPTIASVLILIMAALAMFSIFVISCRSSSTTPTSTDKVEISGFVFKPENITIAVGTMVTLTNKDAAVHTLTSDNDLFDSGNLSKGDTFEYTFNQTGTFGYYCTIHPSMTGKVIVEKVDVSEKDNPCDTDGLNN